MKALPLYPTLPQALVNQVEPLQLIGKSCTACELHKGAKSVCMRPEGEPGGLLIVNEYTSKMDDQAGRPLSSVSGRHLRGLVKRWWQGPVAYDNALKCPPGTVKIKEKHVDACRPYAAQVLADVSPTRILLIGGTAMATFFGRHPPVLSVRRGYGFVFDEAGRSIPVFFVIPPGQAARNRFMAQAMEGDLKWSLMCDTPQPKFDQITYLVETAQHARDVETKHLAGAEELTYDVETHGRAGNPDFRIEACTLLDEVSDSSFTWTREALQNAHAVQPLVRLLEHRGIGKITQNGKYDDRSMQEAYGADVGPVEYDTRLGRKIIDPEAQAKLETLAFLVGMGGHKEEAHDAIAEVCKELRRLAKPPSAVTPKGNARKIKPPKFNVPTSTLRQLAMGEDAQAFAYAYVEPDVLYRYNARDVFSTRAVQRREQGQLKKTGGDFVWNEITGPANRAVRFMENWGIGCDLQVIQQFSAYCKSHLKVLRSSLDQYGTDFNPDSPIQVRKLLFEKLKLKPTGAKTDSGLDSTDKTVLDELQGQHPVIDEITKWRHYGKLDSNYAEGMLIFVRQDGRMHPSILLDGTGTGRASIQDPALQTIPRASKSNPEAQMARNCFTAERGNILLEFDYSQIELRMAAFLSGDKQMIADYQAGIDLHTNNATELCEIAFGIKPAKWATMTKDERDPYRSRIKTVTFAKLYGKTVRTIATEFGVPEAQIKAIDQKIWGKYHTLAKWCQDQIKEARRTGEVWTTWKGQKCLRRPLWKIGDADEYVRRHAENAAVNTPVQGSAAHYTMASLMPIVDFIREEALPARLVLTVHDSVLLEIKETALGETAAGVKAILTGHDMGDVPLVVEAKSGYAWGSMSDYHVAA